MFCVELCSFSLWYVRVFSSHLTWSLRTWFAFHSLLERISEEVSSTSVRWGSCWSCASLRRAWWSSHLVRRPTRSYVRVDAHWSWLTLRLSHRSWLSLWLAHWPWLTLRLTHWSGLTLHAWLSHRPWLTLHTWLSHWSWLVLLSMKDMQLVNIGNTKFIRKVVTTYPCAWIGLTF